MQIQQLFAGWTLAAVVMFAAPSPASADDKQPEHPSSARAAADRDLSLLRRFSEYAFDDAGDAKPPDAGPPGGRPGRSGPADQKAGRGPDDDFGGPGGPEFGPGGPGGPKHGPGEPGGPGGHGRGPGGPDGDKGPPPDGDRHGPGPRPGGVGHAISPDGGRFDGPMHRPDPEMTALLKKEDELDSRANDLAAQYQRAGSAEKDKIQKQIEETVNKQFDVRQQRRKLQLDRMQKELEGLRTLYENKNTSRDSLIKGRVQQLLNGGGLGF
jgi:hypothetical protein